MTNVCDNHENAGSRTHVSPGRMSDEQFRAIQGLRWSNAARPHQSDPRRRGTRSARDAAAIRESW